MLFNSIEYLVFFPVVVLLFFAVPVRGRNLLLLFASYYFYMCWVPKYIVLILFSTVTTWYAASFIETVDDDRKRKIALGINIAVNLLILFVFKYYNFFVDSIAALLTHMGIVVSFPESTLLLPVGISFYTFQSLGYSIDVYRKRLAHERSFVNYALFVSFFPQLVAGPIERAPNLLPQFREHRPFEYDRVVGGLRNILVGMFKKIVVADCIAAYVDSVYGNIHHFSGSVCLAATSLFAMQIYCDFSGYSDIAVGSAAVFGYTLMENFKSPYFASSIADFWARWHISLSTWFKDYVYIPLGGNRRGEFRRYLNLFITFTLSGLWHGTNLTFVVWGMLHGLYRICGAILDRLSSGKTRGASRHSALAKILWVNLLACAAWVFFRADSIGDALGVYWNIFWDFRIASLMTESMNIFTDFYHQPGILSRFSLVGTVVFPLTVLVFDWFRYKRTGAFDSARYIAGFSAAGRWAFYLVAAFWVVFMYCFESAAYSKISQFIYFQF